MLESLYKKKKTGRFDVLFYLITLVFLILGARLFYLQIIEGGYYQAKAEGNRLRMVTMTAARGIMYDRNGQILVGSRPAYTVSIIAQFPGVESVFWRKAEICKNVTAPALRRSTFHVK